MDSITDFISVGIGHCPIPSIGLLDFGPNGLSPLQFQFQMDYDFCNFGQIAINSDQNYNNNCFTIQIQSNLHNCTHVTFTLKIKVLYVKLAGLQLLLSSKSKFRMQILSCI